MKKIILLILATVTFFSCKDEDYPVPTALYFETASATIAANGETVSLPFKTTAPDLKLTMLTEASWCTVKIEGENLVITAEKNNSIANRETKVKVAASDRDITIPIKQSGLPTRKLVITGGSSSSAQSSEGSFASTYDGDVNTYWHSEYSPQSHQYEDHWLLYNLEAGSQSLDLIVISSRVSSGAANGRWGHFAIWVKGDGTDVPSTIEDTSGVNWDGWGGTLGSVDADGFKLVHKGDDTPFMAMTHVTSVVLSQSVTNPTKIKFVLKGSAPNGSRNGHGSVGEIELFGKVQ